VGKSMKILVCGCRDWGVVHKEHRANPRLDCELCARAYAEAATLNDALCEFDGCAEYEHLKLIHGACPTGADALADSFARWLGWEVARCPAQWKVDGKLDRSAGPRRNQLMLDTERPDIVIAFWDGKSRGTMDMMSRAAAAGLRVEVTGTRRAT